MAETEKTVVEANAVNPQADAPKKNAVPSETSPLSNSAEDLGPAVVKPTDSNPDATKKSSKVSDAVNAKATDGDTTSKSDTDGKVTKVAHPGQTLKVEDADADDKEISEGEMPDGLKKYLAKKDGKDTKAEDEDKSKTTDSEKMKKEVKEDVDALLAGEETLSEEFKAKAATIFEAAITSKVKAIAEEIEADQKSKFEEELNSMKATLTEKIDSYLNYVVEEWMKENKIAVERGIKGEIAEDFIGGLKKLFEDHYIDVPDEKYDVLEDQATKIDELEKKLNEQIEKNVELNSKSGDLMKEQIRNEVAADLADKQKEKFNKLSEEIEFTNAEDFRKKVETVKESYFNKKSTTGEQIDDVAATDGDSVNEDLSTAMAAYSAAISKTKDIKLVS